MSLRALTRRLRSEEHGVVLVLVAMLMTVFIACAALAIDLGSLNGAQRQAQAAADAGALAGAAALSTSTVAASATATTFAKSNYPGSTPTVSVSGTPANQVTVRVTAHPPNFFGKAFPVGASAVAGTTIAGSSTVCTTIGSGCMAIFAKSPSCTTGPGAPVSFGGGGQRVDGSVVSNGSVYPGSFDGNSGSQFNGLGNFFGTGSGCTWPVLPLYGDTFAKATPVAQAATAAYPIDYFAKDLPACVPGTNCTGQCDVSTTPCPLANQTPKFCTDATNASTWTLVDYYPFTLSSGNIYCAVGNGTGVLAKNPSTWKGAIFANATGPIRSSFVAGSVTFTGGSNVGPCGYAVSGYTASTCDPTVPSPATTNYPVVAVTGTGTAVDASGGGNTLLGDVFAPFGTIHTGGGDTTGFLEGLNVITGGGATFTGDGPNGSGATSGGSSGSVALLQ
jgi:Flp pilus assembly protein TadG